MGPLGLGPDEEPSRLADDSSPRVSCHLRYQDETHQSDYDDRA